MKTKASVYKVILLLGGCFFFYSAHAQIRGTVEVIKDPRIDTLIAKRFTRLGKTAGAGGTSGFSSYGYRVQIYTGSNRTEAFKAQAKFQEDYPDVPTYISYREPNFKVRIGDFRTRLEAAKMQQNLKPWFPLMFIINEKINPPKLTTDTP
ncbi:SPOR domain-containing protein [Mucilaginibacter ginkgonis]|uniref:SPOR domain-containing protein n=1 Tax=Mucilaginibacter ginkgonis TaxID=2682091 RepID=A0A6I4HZG9_9SPHI|nr:SPOR domain-containing protein [Mucilaginibacter ginkgonis]QQL48748.1 SPOR domain-containing protein [Mucilaginibacter ginkgonis]